MNRVIVTVGLFLIGCQIPQPTTTTPTQNSPPSLKLVPASYYHIRYSPKLRRNIREIIPAKDLEPYEAVIVNGDKEEKVLLDKAAKDIYRSQREIIKSQN